MIYIASIKGIEFIYIFVGAFIGLMFATPIGEMAADVANNSTGLAATIYGYLDEFYALCLMGLMVGSIAGFFYSRRR